MHDSNQSELDPTGLSAADQIDPAEITGKKLQHAQSNFETTRRKVLKGMVYGSVAATITTVPALASVSELKATDTDKPTDSIDSGQLPLQQTGVAVEFSDPESNHIDGAMARVSISNNTDKDIELKHLSPGAITTRDGVYNLNARLKQSPVQVRPNGVYHIWIRPDTEAVSVAPATISVSTQGMIPVTIVRGNAAVQPAKHTRLAHAMFA